MPICVHFGREEKIDAKRKATTNIQYFRCPFRADVFARHLQSQHRSTWERYSAMSNEEKVAFFTENAPVVHRNTLRSHFGGAQDQIHHLVNKDIVDVIISEMFYTPDDDTVAKERALAIFEDVVVPEESELDRIFL
jgi:hypothetical protein